MNCWKKKMPKPLVCLLLHSYNSQQLSVRWMGRTLTISKFQMESVKVVCWVWSCLQLYLDSLLDLLQSRGRECYWDNQSSGAFCYADDLTILSLTPDALRRMMADYKIFAGLHSLHFNMSKTQLIQTSCPVSPHFLFCGKLLPLSDLILQFSSFLFLFCWLVYQDETILTCSAFGQDSEPQVSHGMLMPGPR